MVWKPKPAGTHGILKFVQQTASVFSVDQQYFQISIFSGSRDQYYKWSKVTVFADWQCLLSCRDGNSYLNAHFDRRILSNIQNLVLQILPRGPDDLWRGKLPWIKSLNQMIMRAFTLIKNCWKSIKIFEEIMKCHQIPTTGGADDNEKE